MARFIQIALLASLLVVTALRAEEEVKKDEVAGEEPPDANPEKDADIVSEMIDAIMKDRKEIEPTSSEAEAAEPATGEVETGEAGEAGEEKTPEEREIDELEEEVRGVLNRFRGRARVGGVRVGGVRLGGARLVGGGLGLGRGRVVVGGGLGLGVGRRFRLVGGARFIGGASVVAGASVIPVAGLTCPGTGLRARLFSLNRSVFGNIDRSLYHECSLAGAISGCGFNGYCCRHPVFGNNVCYGRQFLVSNRRFFV